MQEKGRETLSGTRHRHFIDFKRHLDSTLRSLPGSDQPPSPGGKAFAAFLKYGLPTIGVIFKDQPRVEFVPSLLVPGGKRDDVVVPANRMISKTVYLICDQSGLLLEVNLHRIAMTHWRKTANGKLEIRGVLGSKELDEIELLPSEQRPLS